MTPEDKRQRARLIRAEANGRSPDVARTLRCVAIELEELADAQEHEGKVQGPDGTEPMHIPPSGRSGSSSIT